MDDIKILIKIKDIELTLTIDEAIGLKEKLNRILPQQYTWYYPSIRYYDWTSGENSSSVTVLKEKF